MLYNFYSARQQLHEGAEGVSWERGECRYNGNVKVVNCIIEENVLLSCFRVASHLAEWQICEGV